MNMPIEFDAVCNAVAMTIITDPKKMAPRRPKPSDTYGANGYPASAPMF